MGPSLISIQSYTWLRPRVGPIRTPPMSHSRKNKFNTINKFTIFTTIFLHNWLWVVKIKVTNLYRDHTQLITVFFFHLKFYHNFFTWLIIDSKKKVMNVWMWQTPNYSFFFFFLTKVVAIVVNLIEIRKPLRRKVHNYPTLNTSPADSLSVSSPLINFLIIFFLTLNHHLVLFIH